MTVKLLMPVDLHEDEPGWLAFAFDQARALGAEVVLLHVVDYVPVVIPVELPSGYPLPQVDLVKESAEKRLLELAASLDGITVHPVVEVGTAAETIVEVAAREDVDQIIIGSHSRAGLRRMVLGSVAERVARTAHLPVTIVPMDEPEGPRHD